MFNSCIVHRRQVTVSFRNTAYLLPVVFLTFLFSCTVPRRFQASKQFVYNVDVKVEGNQSASEKKDLAARLTNQLDDSLRTQIVSLAGIYRKIVAPPVYDSANVRRSLGFMVSLLNSSGYYSPIIRDTIRPDTVKGHHYLKFSFSHWLPRIRRKKAVDQYRVYISFKVWPGKQLKLDSIGYDLSTPALQALAMKIRPQSLLKKGNPYSKQVLSAELDRLVDTFRNNGYYKFTKEDLVIVRDTVVAALIDPTLDPFQQATLLEQLKKKRDNPTINVVVMQRPVKDSSRVNQYTIGQVTIYPDLPILEDTVTTNRTDTTAARKFTIVSRYDKFNNRFLTRNVFLRPDRMYKQFNYNRTLNKFNQMGAWQQATINMVPSADADTVLDVLLRLYPAKKQNLNVSLELSRNTNYIVTASNLFGTSLSLGLRNRNAFKQSVLSSTNLRGGVELGGDFIQTTQASISHTISFPKLIAPVSIKREYRLDSLRSILDMNASYTDRRKFFTLRSFNTSFGYQWTRNNRTFLWKPLNIEFTNLDKTDSLQKLLDSIPSLRLAFKSGLVIGQQFVYSSTKKSGLHTNFLRFSAEESGATLGFIKQLDEGPLWRYVKGDVEFRHHIDYKKTQLAFRAYAGAGWAYGREGSGFEQTLPFYKAFFAGGPNSMRGWQVRQLGLGSSTYYDTAGGGLVDRFGDVQLEANAEFRFPLGTIFGIKFLSALYVDAGNIWNRHVTDTAKAAQGSNFTFDRFYKEIAVDAGTGLRLDFNYFLIRFDWAYKIRDPQALVNANRWFYGLNLSSGQFQLGLGYPF